LLAEHEGKVVDTKKAYLDKFVESFEDQARTKMPPFLKRAQENCARMAEVFTHRDPLLRQVGMVILYYHLFRFAHDKGWASDIVRKKLLDFEKLRDANRKKAEVDITKADYDLIEFDRFAQSPNDGFAIKFRMKVLLKQAFHKNVSTDSL